MACFLVPAAEAIIISGYRKIKGAQKVSAKEVGYDKVETYHITMDRKLKWLTNLLWGGSVLLMFEHIWHGEVVPVFPFLSATTSLAGTRGMLHEMLTVGVSMALLVTIVWGVMCLVSNVFEKRANNKIEVNK